MRFFILFFLFPFSLMAGNIPRVVIGFWDSVVDKTVDDCLIHRIVEMPLNHLGLNVQYYDIRKPLPDLSQREDVRGIILYFRNDTKMRDPKIFITWANEAMDGGKKLVIMGNPGFDVDINDVYTPEALQNQLYERLGIVNTHQWVEYPSQYRVLKQEEGMVPFEKSLPQNLPGFFVTKVYQPTAKSCLKIGIPNQPEEDADLIIISSHGAYVSQFYANTYDDLLFSTNSRSLGWYLNPFAFFETVFDLSATPIPDTTTLAGRRIYFTNCHGDSWNMDTDIETYARKGVSCAEIILEKIIKPNPDIPVAVGIIAADMDPRWAAKKNSQEVAKKFIALPQVEVGSHTYSHPFYWEFFRNNADEKEKSYLYLYPNGAWESSALSWIRAKSYQLVRPEEFRKGRLTWGYLIPRAYANERFNADKEIFGAIDYINQLMPSGKKLELLIWPGDCRPWDSVVERAYQAGVKNFGGGFFRFDPDYPSYLFVYPIGRKPGGLIQLYECANGDNNYTDNWKDKFYGLQYLPATLKNTESPRRIKPISLYYHCYSGEFQASVDAVLKDIAFIRTQPVIATTVKRYCEVGEGFYFSEIEPIGTGQWKIHNRRGLQTIRFDHAEQLYVDFANSIGVIGYMHFQGSLYIALDAVVQEPVIAVIQEQKDELNYLVESNWEIWNLQRAENQLSFLAKGWGKTSIRWKMKSPGSYSLKTSLASLPAQTLATDHEGYLIMELELPFNENIEFKIEPQPR